MGEVIAALAATGFSLASGAAVSAARRAGETREVVLLLQQQVKVLTEKVDTNFGEVKDASKSLEMRFCHLCERVQNLENDFREHAVVFHNQHHHQ